MYSLVGITHCRKTAWTKQASGNQTQKRLTAKIDIEKDAKGGDKNVIKEALTPDDKGYLGGSGSRLVSSPAPSSQINTSLPSWAQS